MKLKKLRKKARKLTVPDHPRFEAGSNYDDWAFLYIDRKASVRSYDWCSEMSIHELERALALGSDIWAQSEEDKPTTGDTQEEWYLLRKEATKLVKKELAND